jgi:glycosyltransferase involved in cell wall biosynthesis
VSVVVPAYNAQKRVAASLGSIVSQDYDPIEVVFVDDASTDGTKEAARSILEKSARCHKIMSHGVNKGVSSARNTGMRASTGEYLIFMDADDEADGNFISTLHGAITRDAADAAFCGFRDRYEATGEEVARPVRLNPEAPHTPEEITVKRLLKKIFPCLWTTLFKKDFLDGIGISFSADCAVGEDSEFLIKAFSHAGKISFSPLCPYVYVHHDEMGSMTGVASEDKKLLRYEQISRSEMKLAVYLKENSPSPKVRDIASRLLLPESHMRFLTMAAKRGDYAKFIRMLDAPQVRSALRSSWRYAHLRPEVFYKALCALLFPRAYFDSRSRP